MTGERAPKPRRSDRADRRKAADELTPAPTSSSNRSPPRTCQPGRKHVRILYAAQIGVAPPSFVLFTNVATTFHFSYERFLVNKLREHFGFVGTPIWVQVCRRAPKRKGDRTAAKRRKEE
jgi:GTP-binding protein